MSIGEAYAIFKQIDSEKFTLSQKLIAIQAVAFEADTINGITKDELRSALCWLWKMIPGQNSWHICSIDLAPGESQPGWPVLISQSILPKTEKEKVCENCISFIPATGLSFSRCANLKSPFTYTMRHHNCVHFDYEEADHE